MTNVDEVSSLSAITNDSQPNYFSRRLIFASVCVTSCFSAFSLELCKSLTQITQLTISNNRT